MASRPNPILEDLARIKRELEALGRMNLKVGIQGDADGELLTIANVHEYGCTIKVSPKMRGYFRHAFNVNLKATTEYINIPERSFIRASFDAGQQEMNDIVSKAFDKLMKGDMTAEQAMESIGLQLVQMTQNFINTGQVKPPKGEFAQERSSQYTPLVDSGRLVLSITHVIEGGGS